METGGGGGGGEGNVLETVWLSQEGEKGFKLIGRRV